MKHAPPPLPTDDARLSSIAHLTLFEQVYAQLRTAIMEGEFASGETLTIRTLAQQLGTSVMPVREALRRISAEGGLDMLPNRSVRIPSMDAGRIAEICRLRTLLEGDAAALAAQRITREELAVVRDHHRAFLASVRTGAAPRLLRAGQHFHFAIYEAARAPTMLSFIGMLWLQSGPWLAEPLRRAFPRQPIRAFVEAIGGRHRAIIDALESGDPDRAATAVRAEMTDLTTHLQAIPADGPPSPP